MFEILAGCRNTPTRQDTIDTLKALKYWLTESRWWGGARANAMSEVIGYGWGLSVDGLPLEAETLYHGDGEEIECLCLVGGLKHEASQVTPTSYEALVAYLAAAANEQLPLLQEEIDQHVKDWFETHPDSHLERYEQRLVSEVYAVECVLIEFNDNPETTLENVIALVDRAIEIGEANANPTSPAH